jgi:integrase
VAAGSLAVPDLGISSLDDVLIDVRRIFCREKQQLQIRRSWVCGRIDQPKTENSKKPMPVDPKLRKILMEHRTNLPASLRMTEWVFPGKRTGMPSHPWTAARQRLVPAGKAAGVGRIGWHTFRHTYSTLLNERYGHEGSTRTAASRRHPDDHEHLHAGPAGKAATGKQQNVGILLPTGTA